MKKTKKSKKAKIYVAPLELDPEAIDNENLDENELVITSGDGYYLRGNKNNRNFW